MKLYKRKKFISLKIFVRAKQHQTHSIDTKCCERLMSCK